MGRKRVNEGMTDVEELGLQMTPMIDCIFQLIIFFMLNIHFRSEEGLLKAFLPKASTAPAEEDPNKDKVFIKIGEASPGVLLVAVNGQAVGGATEAQKYAALETRLKAIKEGFPKMPPVIIDASSRLPYRYVISALNVCGKLEFQDVMFMFPQE